MRSVPPKIMREENKQNQYKLTTEAPDVGYAVTVIKLRVFVGKKGKGRYSSSWEPHLRATGRHLLYWITQCYLPPDTSERDPPNPSHAGL